MTWKLAATIPLRSSSHAIGGGEMEKRVGIRGGPRKSGHMGQPSVPFTGLGKLHVYISQKQGSHSARIKVSIGGKYDAENCSSISIAPVAAHKAGKELPPQQFKDVAKWVALNRPQLLDYWDGKLSTEQILAKLKPL